MNLNDFPDEVLCQIFDNLDVYEMKRASLVCRRWAELTFSGQRMDRVWLVQPDGGWELVLNTRRSYRNIRQHCWVCDVQLESLAWLLRTLKFPIRMLDMQCIISSQRLRCTLLEVPELQDLSIKFNIDANCKTIEPLPDLTKLKCLKLSKFGNNRFDFFRMNVANLQSLYMSCATDSELEMWRQLSGQLKLAHVYWVNATYISQFLEPTFPHLENFTIGEIHYSTTEDIASSRSHDFFRRHSLLRRLSVSVPISVEWIRSITSHCSELTYLSLLLMYPEEGILESLVQLTKLRHLSFLTDSGEAYSYLNRSPYTKLDTKVFHGAINSLESVEFEMPPTRVFLENLFEAAPQLNCLEIKPKNLQLDIEFICEKFSCLRRLELDVRKQTLADNSVRIDRLEHLEELKIRNAKSISFIHHNNVRCLTLSLPKIKNKDLGQIAEKFPRLNRLTIDSCPWLSESGIIWLHKMIPSCRIDFGSQRFYPQVYPLERRSARIKARKT